MDGIMSVMCCILLTPYSPQKTLPNPSLQMFHVVYFLPKNPVPLESRDSSLFCQEYWRSVGSAVGTGVVSSRPQVIRDQVSIRKRMQNIWICALWSLRKWTNIISLVVGQCQTDQTAIITFGSTCACISPFKYAGGTGAVVTSVTETSEKWYLRRSQGPPPASLHSVTPTLGLLCPPTLHSCYPFSHCVPDSSYL